MWVDCDIKDYYSGFGKKVMFNLNGKEYRGIHKDYTGFGKQAGDSVVITDIDPPLNDGKTSGTFESKGIKLKKEVEHSYQI